MLCGVLGIQTLSSKVSRSVYFLRDIFGTYSVLVMLIHNYVCICALISCRSSVARDRLLWPVYQDIIRDIQSYTCHFLPISFIHSFSFVLESCVAPLQEITTHRRSQPSHGQRKRDRSSKGRPFAA